MREVKFRSPKIKRSQERELKFRYTCDRGNGHVFSEDFTLAEIEHSGASHWIAMNLIAEGQLHRRQYTGLKDKNGVEIYEGDIVKNWWWDCNKKFIGHDWVIKFGEYDDSEIDWGSAGLGFYCENKLGEQESPVNLAQDKGIEVIGNIYEGKSLLGKTDLYAEVLAEDYGSGGDSE